MDYTTLTAEQYAPIIAKLMKQRDYLGKLMERMKANRFPVDDPLYAAIARAWEGASGACVAACTCRNGTCGPPPGGVMARRPWGGG
jgi:hypothetical protein